jgi:hypothetical protein
VKNGWHCEHTSVWISACVERVWNVLPQAHFTVAVAYSGWMSGFMANLWCAGSEREGGARNADAFGNLDLAAPGFW